MNPPATRPARCRPRATDPTRTMPPARGTSLPGRRRHAIGAVLACNPQQLGCAAAGAQSCARAAGRLRAGAAEAA